MVFYRVRKVKGRYYLVKEWYDPVEKRKKSTSIGPCERIERIFTLLKDLSDEQIAKLVEAVRNGLLWCGGWDLNPRRPTPSGPEPDPFDLARAPPHHFTMCS